MGEAKRRRLAQQTGRQTKRIRDLSGEWCDACITEPAQRIFERHLQIEATSANDPLIAAAVPCGRRCCDNGKLTIDGCRKRSSPFEVVRLEYGSAIRGTVR